MFLVICEITSNTISMCLPITELNCSGLKQNCQVESLKVELEGILLLISYSQVFSFYI